MLPIWSKDRVEKLAQRLNYYREQLSLRLLPLLNSHCELQDEKLNLLDQTSQEIIEVVSINFNSLNLKLDDHHRSEEDLRQQEQEKAEIRHAGIIAAILTTQDGNSRTIKVGDR